MIVTDMLSRMPCAACGEIHNQILLKEKIL